MYYYLVALMKSSTTGGGHTPAKLRSQELELRRWLSTALSVDFVNQFSHLASQRYRWQYIDQKRRKIFYYLSRSVSLRTEWYILFFYDQGFVSNKQL